ncbi:hypothetical protein GCM10023185_06960 [Hymenobacter saemangeumensis]|uniref:DUF1320 domain-containing protein n=1 Tax=Hymenobacter saemangeumensis TaxID=1084522 RepID=A0ABP8I2U6_9BACT
MGFLVTADYGTLIRQEQLDIVLSGTPTALTQAEIFAQELIESYLRTRYDVAAIFGAEGEERSALIVTYMVDITLYTVHARHGRVAMPEKRIDRYDQAIDWLKAVATGKISANLPLLPLEDRTGGFKWGSAPRQTLSW